MTEPKAPEPVAPPAEPKQPDELSEEELGKVSGGVLPNPLPREFTLPGPMPSPVANMPGPLPHGDRRFTQ